LYLDFDRVESQTPRQFRTLISSLSRGKQMKTNYPAIFVSAIVYWLLGAVWYGVLFSKPWMALENITMEQAKSMSPVLPYIVTFVLNLVIAFFLAQLCSWRNASSAARGASLGVLLWIGFVGPITYTTSMYELKPFNLFLINEGYSLVGLLLMGAILGAWTKKSA
jgi:hypothetical protein